MGILHIVHWIFIRFGTGQINIEIQLGIIRTHIEEITYSIDTDFLNKLTQGNGFSSPFAHPYNFAIFNNVYHLHNTYGEYLRRITERLYRGTHSSDIAVVIRPPNVNDFIVTTI